MDVQHVVNWGLISTANIANKNVRAMEISKNSRLVAVASRSIEKANLFAKDNSLSGSVKLYSSYQDLTDDDDVQAIYLPLPTKMHLEWALKVALAGKHLLIEKPAAIDSGELRKIIYEFKRRGLHFMDGVMFMHHDRLSLLRTSLQDPFAGEVRWT
jgi:predicted dehydrogenase